MPRLAKSEKQIRIEKLRTAINTEIDRSHTTNTAVCNGIGMSESTWNRRKATGTFSFADLVEIASFLNCGIHITIGGTTI